MGAACTLFTVGFTAFLLFASGRTLGSGLHFEVQLASTGALKTNAKLRIAGQEVGEIRGLRRIKTPEGVQVLIDCFLARKWDGAVRRNSSAFIATPSVLGEAYLEIGPPLHGDPGPALREGDRLRGVDPPEIDRMIGRLYHDLSVVVMLLRVHRPELDALFQAGGSLLATASGLTADPEQLGRIRDRTVRAIDDTVALIGAMRDAKAAPRLRAIAADLAMTADRIGPDLSALGNRIALAIARTEELVGYFEGERRQQLRPTLSTLARAVEITQGVARDVQRLADRVARGQGTIGALLADQELYEDLHETHRILKSQPWTLVVKPAPGEKSSEP